ncbi:GT4 family glycosyltransferase PelF [Hydrogenophaga sp.]|uniref:GT4 family glycosyltransferase PelF n=1 Tax=Hydrogenophaga sp. TaxID=1904254 RepID=UPI0027247B11|nr:GT4 family glycosyltransferase PelF [Hydrogenophaga sp.]MDO9606603.1 GT4 family glycosyltransferase PelF [Hydrogenophaga sp.]
MSDPALEPDITLLLEGTYPFVRGGVSGWVHQLIEGMPDITFALVYLGAERPDEEVLRYSMPSNVIDLQCHYLMEDLNVGEPEERQGDPAFFRDSEKLHDWFRCPVGKPDPGWVERVLLQEGSVDNGYTRDFFFSHAAWEQIKKSYNQFCPDASFQAYFWSVRNMHAPLLKLSSIARGIKPGKAIHTVTTGYAGLLGVMLRQINVCPLILTEHGIYTKERKIELQSRFLRETPPGLSNVPEAGMEHHHQSWVRMFEGVGRLVYQASDPIISLYELNRQRQVHDGADPSRTRIIPNGVDVTQFVHLRGQRAATTPRVLGLIGRIVPIKDIKTFIRCVGVLATRMPDVEGWLIGPEEEDPLYVDECRDLVQSLKLEKHIRFMGFQKVQDVLPQLGLMVLTSISEAFPLVLLEGFASGLPALTTDVGACRDLIYGAEPEDRALGSAGVVVPMVDHDAMAQAAFALFNDPARWKAAQQAGIARVERYYQQSFVIDHYRSIYQEAGVG